VKASCSCAKQAGAEADHGHHAVLETGARHAGGLGLRHHVQRLVVEDEAQRVGIVHRDVEDHPAAGVRARHAPALEMLRQMHRVEHPRGERPADLTRLNGGAHGAVRGGVPEMMVGAEHHARGGATHRPSRAHPRASAPAASRTGRACRRPPRRASARDAARWWC
jgi:hypothetical protein